MQAKHNSNQIQRCAPMLSMNLDATCRAEVKTLLLADRAAANVERAGAIGPPSWRLLGGAALVAGIPYIAFGCLDNCIMVGAGVGASTLVGLGQVQAVACHYQRCCDSY